jgi:hypothetical protein
MTPSAGDIEQNGSIFEVWVRQRSQHVFILRVLMARQWDEFHSIASAILHPLCVSVDLV